MKLKDYLQESFNKEYGYRVKFAMDCGSEEMDIIEKCLAKYNVVSISDFKRKPIEENPMEFVRAKGVQLVSEVCSTDIVLKYPVNDRILEVWLAVNLGLDHEKVICYGVKDPRRVESEIAEIRHEQDKDRYVSEEDAEFNKEDQAHYENENMDVDFNEALFGESYNEKFLAELQKIKDEKGADYFRNYPSKDELMGDALRPTYDNIVGTPNMGKGAERGKEVDRVAQHGARSR
tara:strand:- start:3316 stop:4014 length:699 start_codon:yes stop_codon:yes gene_type:complete